jgi:uncharacterized protein YjbJ (UPF0337 family)
MSIASDIRSYADKAQAQLNDVTGQANELVGKVSANASVLTDKLSSAANDLRASAEKSVNFDAIKAAVEPYIAQVKGYRATATDRAEAFVASLKDDPRVGKLVDAAGSVTGVVVETVQERVVKPVQALTNRGTKPVAKSAAKPTAAAKPAPTPKATRPATTKPATKTAGRKAPAKRATKA